MSTTHHYDHHLGPVYTWMVGDLNTALAKSRLELDELAIQPSSGGIAVDLGAGFGLHSVPLAERGYAVIAIDSCKVLLDEIRSQPPLTPICTIIGDLSAFSTHLRQPADVILCMGDTLTHLPEFADVDRLLDDAAVALRRGGVFAATFRDYAGRPLSGDDRFIPVRSDDDRILTCFLEYGDERVTVHDLMHERVGDRWQQRVSSYRKLRLPPTRIVERLNRLGFEVRLDSGSNGMVRVRGTRV
jgi:SAM-dependent methyltransferase